MTTLTTLTPTAARAFTPSTVDRILLGLSSALARAAERRMLTRRIRVVESDARRAARDQGRSLHAEAEFTLRVR